jgi:putative hydrolase of the HAD superfamily
VSLSLDGIAAVVFDAVGTLIHPEPAAPHIYAEVGRRYGSRRSVEEIAVRFRDAFRREEVADKASGWRTSEEREVERWRRIVGTVLDDVEDAGGSFSELYEHFSRPTAWRFDDDATQILTTLTNRGKRVAVASNYDRRLFSVLAGWPAHPVFVSSAIGWRKPAPEFFAAVCRGLGLTPREVLYVGDDRVIDFDGARAAGLAAALVGPGVARLRDLFAI